MKEKQKDGVRSTNDVAIHFSDNAINAAHYILAISIFKSFLDQGLLTEEEYRTLAAAGEKEWRNLLKDDEAGTNMVVFQEEE